MFKEINLKISKERNLTFRFPILGFSRLHLLNFVAWLNPLILGALILLALSFEYWSYDASRVVIIMLYCFVSCILGLQILAKILSKADFFPSFAYDIYTLLVVSVVAFSLFMNAVIFQNNTNIWGGLNLKAISAVSIITYWFLYYLIGINFAKKGREDTLIKLFGLAPIPAVLILITNPYSSFANLADVFVIFIPAWTLLLLAGKQFRYLALMNLFLGLISLFWASGGAKIAGIFGFTFTSCYLINNSIGNLKSQFNEVKLATKDLLAKKIGLAKYLLNNYQAIFILLALVVTIIGAIWLSLSGRSLNLQEYIVNGTYVINRNLNWQAIILGGGLQDKNTTGFLSLLIAYGILPVIAGLFTLVKLAKDIKNSVKNKLPSEIIQKIYFLATILISISVYFVCFRINDIVIILAVIAFAILATIMQTYFYKKELVPKIEINDYTHIKVESTREFLRIFQYVLSLGIVALTIYLIYLVGIVDKALLL